MFRPQTAKRAFTLVELLLVVALTTIVVGAVTCMYLFTAERTAHAVANSTVLSQAERVMEKIDFTVTNATSCTTSTLAGGTALKCIMPSNGSSPDAAGYYQSFAPSSVSRRCTEHWGTGQRVWYYWSDATGNPNNSGSYLWRAKRTDDSNPTTTDSDSTWTFYYGGSRALSSLLTGLTFSVNSAAQTVTMTLQGSEETRSSNVATSNETSMSDSISFTRTTYWRNWRQ